MKISIHAPREGSDGEDVRGDPSFSFISIHAPREGSDAVIVYFLSFLSNFNPRSPRGERPDAPQRHNRTARFQSTLPARGATTSTCFLSLIWIISIHAPREGSDAASVLTPSFRPAFQSTLPARGATLPFGHIREEFGISIHAPREGSDSISCDRDKNAGDFNPRSPRGERRMIQLR